MNSADQDSPAIFLEWDSRFFGRRIARIKSRCLTAEEVEQADRWSREKQIDCLYYLADGANPLSSHEAEKNDYHLVDLRVTFARDLSRNIPSAPFENIRKGRIEDLIQLKKMVRENHTISRFFADTHFDARRSAEMYEVWIEKDLLRENGQLWVKDLEGLAVAYTSVTIERDNAVIGLVGVDKAHWGRGYGSELIAWTLSQLASMGIKMVEVVTQGRNYAAQNLYQKHGFVTKSIDFWYHKWFS